MDWYGWALPVEQSAAFRKATEGWGDRDGLAEFVLKMGRLTLPLEKDFDVRVADKTVEQIGRLRSRPFMITCSFNAPHDGDEYPYHLADDPGETRNLAGQEAHQEQKLGMADALQAWLKRTGWRGRSQVALPPPKGGFFSLASGMPQRGQKLYDTDTTCRHCGH